ncbi:hypothetical protein VC83_06408 [Pseudogymnoascus destructans]|uniref:Uncharacterized protein n=2 Tax=Pseudogymnoascus destructans TaxID=655981 RepID=L8G9W9_PSED2|nr:uncharacterized protein VC83_06408 [Pseudogymnoascus destructans]ELR10005.1 hypothetical protein GMDG_00763 [Pseudogymnoascus destructans 20631-21]OAF58396.1 hypothetical protein VC83_06408 [Pseudogymnoascus destructans]
MNQLSSRLGRNIYERAQKEFLPDRDSRTGKFVVRDPKISPVMNEFSLMQSMAAGMLNERNEFDLRKVSGKEIGMQKLPAARKVVLNREARLGG